MRFLICCPRTLIFCDPPCHPIRAVIVILYIHYLINEQDAVVNSKNLSVNTSNIVSELLKSNPNPSDAKPAVDKLRPPPPRLHLRSGESRAEALICLSPDMLCSAPVHSSATARALLADHCSRVLDVLPIVTTVSFTQIWRHLASQPYCPSPMPPRPQTPSSRHRRLEFASLLSSQARTVSPDLPP